MGWLVVVGVIGALYPPIGIAMIILTVPAFVLLGIAKLADSGSGNPYRGPRDLRHDPVFLVVATAGTLLIVTVIYIVIRHG
jgi:hypothetical protein